MIVISSCGLTATVRLLVFLTITIATTLASLHAGAYSVTITGDAGAGSLRQAILDANADPAASSIHVDTLPSAITLASDLPALTNPNGITIYGWGCTIDGGSTSISTGYRVFFIGVAASEAAVSPGLAATTNTNWSIRLMTIRNANARGGQGGNGGEGGGGGAGLGGAIFVNAGQLELSEVTLTGNRAIGGNKGSNLVVIDISAGGGGGMGGKGGNGVYYGAGGGGGGLGSGAYGGGAGSAPSSGAAGGAGILIGGESGGSGEGTPTYPASAGGAGGGGGGGGFAFANIGYSNGNAGTNGGGGGGGIAGVDAGSYSGDGVRGGFGGGGGGGGNSSQLGGYGGNGGYGGGGGAGAYGGAFSGTNGGKGGDGGFGGGGGGAGYTAGKYLDPGYGYWGTGGFGAGNGGPYVPSGGGGGLGAGGAIFVRKGASIQLASCNISGGSVQGGIGYDNGQGIGTGLFLAGNASYSSFYGETDVLADTIGGGIDPEITGGFTKVGYGRLVLTGNNNYIGGTTITEGTLAIGNGGTTGAIIGNVINNSALEVNRSDALTFDGIISGTGTLSKIGTGTLTLTANNTSSGTTTVTGGTLSLGAGGTTGTVAGNIENNGILRFDRSDAVTHGGSIYGSGSMIKLGSEELTLTGNVSQDTGGITISAGTLTVGRGGNIQGGGATTGMIYGNVINDGALKFNRAENIVFNGNISGSGSLTKTGFGTLTLGGNNSYIGGTNLNLGTLVLNSPGALGSAGPIYCQSTLKHTANNTVDYSPRFGNANYQNYTVDTNNQNITWASTLASSGGNLNKLGGGKLTLAGNNIHSGQMVVVNGTLQLTGSNNNVYQTQIQPGAYLSIGDGGSTGSLSGNIINNNPLNWGGTLRFSHSTPSTFTGNVSGVGDFWKSGAGVLSLTGNASHGGITVITSGTLSIGNGGTTGSLAGNVSTSGTLQFNHSNSITHAGNVTGTGGLTKLGAANLTLTGTIDYNGPTTISGGIIDFSSAADSSLIGPIGGAGGIIKSGSGKLTLYGDNDFSGGTTINDGTLALASGGTVAGQLVNNSSTTQSSNYPPAGLRPTSPQTSVAPACWSQWDLALSR